MYFKAFRIELTRTFAELKINKINKVNENVFLAMTNNI